MDQFDDPGRGPAVRSSLLQWMVLCAAAEGVGMTAAAGAARSAQAMGDGPGPGTAGWWGLGVIVAAGLVEGVALGTAQAWPLGRVLPRLRRSRYVVATVLVAGLGWAAASAPSVLAEPEPGPSPSAWVMLAGGAGLGLMMGLVLGGAQGWTLRGVLSRPGRWLVASAAAWTPAMIVIMLGASRPADDWGTVPVVLTGSVTGVLAGSVLGAVLWWFLPWVCAPATGVSVDRAAARSTRPERTRRAG